MQAKMHVAACIFDAKIYQGQAQLLMFFLKITRSPIVRLMGRPGGMRGGAGERFEGC